MDPLVYTAAMEGKMEKLVDRMGQVDQERTPYKNTVLHTAAQYGQSEFVGELLEKLESSVLTMLLPAKNLKGDTALHVAAREGQSLIVRSLVLCARKLDGEDPEKGLKIVEEILTSVNEEGDTVLHEALRTSIVCPEDDVGPSLDDVRLLVYPDFPYPANKAGETPLYLAAECQCYQMVSQIANSEASAAGPGDTTALHAAVISNNEEITAFLLGWNKDLARKPDMKGRTPLHYAAEYGHVGRVRQLLAFDKSLGYQITREEDGKSTALLLAARKGHLLVLEELANLCAGCWDIVNSRGQNILHVAVESKKPKVINLFRRRPTFFGSLLNQKDNDGNTPLHVAAATGDRLLGGYFSKKDYLELHYMSYNNENKSALDIFTESVHGSLFRKKLKVMRVIADGIPQVCRNENTNTIFIKKEKNQRKADRFRLKLDNLTKAHSGGGVEGGGKTRDNAWSTQLLVASLVATATFAAGMSMPGGYNGNQGPNQGVPLLLRQAAFQAFVISDALAMASSTAAMLFYIISSIASKKDMYHARIVALNGTQYTVISVVLMALAFITGSYAVLAPLPAVGITMCLLTSIYFAVGVVKFTYPSVSFLILRHNIWVTLTRQFR